MATHSTLTNRILVAGGFAVAAVATPIIVGLSTPAAPSGPALANCPPNEVVDPASGACRPITNVAPPTMNPINPEGALLAPGSITSSQNVGELPEINGIPCDGGNTGQCIGLAETLPHNNVQLPPVPIGVQP
jgi:hypothetical protein